MPQLGLYNFIDHHTDGPRYSAGLSDGYLINSQHVAIIDATPAVSLGNVWRAEDVPKINGNPEYETDEDAELNDKPGASDGGEENCFLDIFQSSQKTCKQWC